MGQHCISIPYPDYRIQVPRYRVRELEKRQLTPRGKRACLAYSSLVKTKQERVTLLSTSGIAPCRPSICSRIYPRQEHCSFSLRENAGLERSVLKSRDTTQRSGRRETLMLQR